jgi:hypothetical protein
MLYCRNYQDPSFYFFYIAIALMPLLPPIYLHIQNHSQHFVGASLVLEWQIVLQTHFGETATS